MKLIIAALLLLAPSAVNAQRRAVMENLATTNNVVFISSTTDVYAFIKRLTIGGLGIPTTTFLDVYGIVRISSGIVTMGGNARGANANDLQLTRAVFSQVASGERSVIGGGGSNGATALGNTVAGGISNYTSSQYGTISGGLSNLNYSDKGFIGGGGSNTVSTNTTGGVIAGGTSNSVNDTDNPARPSGVLGGTANTATNASAVAGGYSNYGNLGGFVGAGFSNNASFGGAVGSGSSNDASGNKAFIGAGESNTASGADAAVPGGRLNTASGNYSFAAGHRCKATAAGAFCLSDSTDVDVTNSTADSLRTRFGGGLYFDGATSTFTAVVIRDSSSPASGAACVRGSLTWDANYIYVCTATAVWKRSALTGGY